MRSDNRKSLEHLRPCVTGRAFSFDAVGRAALARTSDTAGARLALQHARRRRGTPRITRSIPQRVPFHSNIRAILPTDPRAIQPPSLLILGYVTR